MTDEPLSATTDTSYSSTWSDGQATDHTDATAESPVIGAPAGPSSYRRATHYSPAIPTPSMSQIIRTCQWDTEKVPGAVYMKNSATGREVELWDSVPVTDSNGQPVPFFDPEKWEGTEILTLQYLPTFQGAARQAVPQATNVSKEGFKKVVKSIIETYRKSWAGTDSFNIREEGHRTELSSLVLEALSHVEAVRDDKVVRKCTVLCLQVPE